WLWHHDPFGKGEPSDPLGTFTYDLRFPGQFFDQSTRLHYNYFRDYDPRLGRYIESDPIGLRGGINTYAYAKGNPLRVIDPSGLREVHGSHGEVYDVPDPLIELGGNLFGVSPPFQYPKNFDPCDPLFDPLHDPLNQEILKESLEALDARLKALPNKPRDPFTPDNMNIFNNELQK
ncbi:MAG: RHS repeat domain-containing protein, partial [Methylocella sp.]